MNLSTSSPRQRASPTEEKAREGGSVALDENAHCEGVKPTDAVSNSGFAKQQQQQETQGESVAAKLPQTTDNSNASKKDDAQFGNKWLDKEEVQGQPATASPAPKPTTTTSALFSSANPQEDTDEAVATQTPPMPPGANEGSNGRIGFADGIDNRVAPGFNTVPDSVSPAAETMSLVNGSDNRKTSCVSATQEQQQPALQHNRSHEEEIVVPPAAEISPPVVEEEGAIEQRDATLLVKDDTTNNAVQELQQTQEREIVVPPAEPTAAANSNTIQHGEKSSSTLLVTGNTSNNFYSAMQQPSQTQKQEIVVPAAEATGTDDNDTQQFESANDMRFIDEDKKSDFYSAMQPQPLQDEEEMVVHPPLPLPALENGTIQANQDHAWLADDEGESDSVVFYKEEEENGLSNRDVEEVLVDDDLVVTDSSSEQRHSSNGKYGVTDCDEWPPGLSYVQNEHRQSLLFKQQKEDKDNGENKHDKDEEEIHFVSPEDAKDDFFAMVPAESSQSLHLEDNNNNKDEDTDVQTTHSGSFPAKQLEADEYDSNDGDTWVPGSAKRDKSFLQKWLSSSSRAGRGPVPWFRHKYFRLAMYGLGVLVAALAIVIYVMLRGGGGEDDGQNDGSFNAGQQSVESPSESSAAPSFSPSVSPSTWRSPSPSKNPSLRPSGRPSDTPSTRPSVVPSFGPTGAPSGSPLPTLMPSRVPSSEPSAVPTESLVPTVTPSLFPSGVPSHQPTINPTVVPSNSMEPSQPPTMDGISRLESLLPQYTLDVLAINDPSSPQVLAMNWMAADPGIHSSYDEDFRLLQRFSLATLFYSTSGNAGAWSTTTDWLSYAVHECDWIQVYPAHMNSATHPPCNAQKEFMSIVLVGNGLDGEIPKEVGLLKSLVTLDIESNSLVGSLPTTLGEMTSLTKIGVENNNLSGQIPTEIGLLTDLIIFDLNNNQFSGTLPEELGNLVNVQYFLIQGSSFQGGIPVSYRNQTSIVSADISGSSLSGPLDGKLWWPNALSIDLSFNKFNGSFPDINSGSYFGDLQQLTSLNLRNNQLTGNLSTHIGSLNNLRFLHLDGNSLVGKLPTEIAFLPDLQLVQVHETSLSGPVPQEVCDHIADIGFDLVITCSSLSCDCGCQCMLESFGVNPSSDLFPLVKCQGDCDGDSHCASGLRCWQRDTSILVPGCYGAGTNTWDYCYEPVDAPMNLVEKSAATKGICQGACSTDGSCFGDLKCFVRTGSEAVPGCTGVGVPGQSYCYFEQPSSGIRALGDIGDRLLPEGTFPLGECFGECNFDGDCAKGLDCFQRAALETVPGCFGRGASDSNYCYNPQPSLQFIDVRRDLQGQDYCMDVESSNTNNGNHVNLYSPCHSDPNQRWYFDSNLHFRSALDHGKCLVGSSGSVSLGTLLMIHDCFTNDDRFKYEIYSDGTIRPYSNSHVCVGGGAFEQLQLKDCADVEAQDWMFVLFPSLAAWSPPTLDWVPQGQALFGRESGDDFGESVALSADGMIVAVGGDDHNGEAGHIRVFQWDTEYSVWDQMGEDIHGAAADDSFGESVSLSADGTIVAAGGVNYDGLQGDDTGHIRIYQFNDTHWNQLGKDIEGEGSRDDFGESIALSSNGTIVAAGSQFHNGAAGEDSGHIRIFEFNGSDWNQLGQDIQGVTEFDYFGESIALSSDGMVVASGASWHHSSIGEYSGQVRVFKFNGTDWSQMGQTLYGEKEGDEFGDEVALSADGMTLAASADHHDENGSSSGQVRVFLYNESSSTWGQIGNSVYGVESYEFFGESLALSADGTRFVAGASWNDERGDAAGQIRVYGFDGMQWSQMGQDINGAEEDEEFGDSVAISADGGIVAGGGNKAGPGRVAVLKWFGG